MDDLVDNLTDVLNPFPKKELNFQEADMCSIRRSIVRGERSLKWAGRGGQKPPSAGSVAICLNVHIGKDFTWVRGGIK